MDFLLDARHAIRQFRRNPVLAATAVLTLGLGIGAATAAFAVARDVLWRPLPFAAPDRLVAVWEADARHAFANRNEVSFADFLAWRDSGAGFDHLAALAYRSLNLTGTGDPERLEGAAPSVDFFDMLGVRPQFGRAFSKDEEDPSAAPTAMLSHGLWVRRFGADPSVVGRTIALNGVATTVIGVLPADFRFEFPTGRAIDIWVPRVVTPQAREARRSRGLYVVGRLTGDVTPAAAQARLSSVMARLAAAYPDSNAGWDARVIPLREQIAGSARTPLVVLLAAGVCLLLIVCANLGTLLLAQTSARHGEMAVRSAIGASAVRLRRQLLTEHLVLALVGGGAGLAIALWGVGALRQDAIGLDLPRLHEVGLDGVAVAFAALLSLASALAFGLLPARLSVRQALTGDLTQALRGAASRHGTAAAARQSALAAAEVAIAVVLVIAAGLLFKSLARLQQVDPGFDPRGVLTFQLSLPSSSYADPSRIAAFYDELTAKLSALAGVSGAGAVTNLPLGGSNQTSSVSIEGQPDTSERLPEAHYRGATPGYFSTMRIRLDGGRYFDRHDTASAPPVAIVNEAMARRFWGAANPVGRRLKFGHASAPIPWTTVVGVVADVRHDALQAAPEPEVYVPQAQDPSSYMYVAVRLDPGAGDAAGLAGAAAAVVHTLDKALPVFEVAPYDALVDEAIAGPRLNARLMGVFGLVALLLAVGGTYGVVSYATSRRTREIGVRIALGADRGDVMRLLVGRGAGATLAGAAIGTLAALAVSRVLASMLFGVTSHDTSTFVAAPLLLAAVALVASAIPAWRATKVDPASVLRAE